MVSFFSTLAVIYRQFLVWKKLFWSSMATNIANPILFLFAFGFGLGRFVEVMGGVSYMIFVVPGMMAYSAMFAASFETTIGSFSRYYLHRNWNAVLSTPVTLAELLLGEVLWASFKGTISASCVLFIGWLWGGVESLSGALFCLPIVFFSCLCFGSFGLLATAYAKGYEFFSYFFTFWVTPMFVFCGVFFEVNKFPDFIQSLSWFFPMTHLVLVIRPLTTGLPIDLITILTHGSYFVVGGLVAFSLAYFKIRLKLFD